MQIGLIVALVVFLTVLLVQGLGGQPTAKTPIENLAWTPLGWENAACLVIGIAASNLFDNSSWARVFACRDAAVVRRSFGLAGLGIGLLLIPTSLMGLWAAGTVPADANPAALPATLLQLVAPTWAVVVFLVLALLLAMSTVSALFNGLVGVLTSDARDLAGAPADGRTLRWARLGTLLLAVPAVGVATLGKDATYLFFVANLVCAAAVVPVFLGLWATRLSGGWVLTAFAVAVTAGTLWFPADILGGTWLEVPGGQRFITSYLLALGLSSAIAGLGAALGRRRA